MIRRFLIATLVVNSLAHLAASAICLGLGQSKISEYGQVLMITSVATAICVGAFGGNGGNGGSGTSRDYETQMTSLHALADFSAADQTDQKQAASLGLLCFIGACLSGATGYALMTLAAQ